MPIKEVLIKELLLFLDNTDLKDLDKKELELIAKGLSDAVIRVVPVKKRAKLKLVKTG